MNIRQPLAALLLTLFVFASSAAAQTSGACVGFDSRLTAGSEARVTPGTPNNIRTRADRDAERIGQIPAGDSFQVLDGPVCADGVTWWEVRYGSLIGWTAEGLGSEYYLEPLPELGTGGAGGGAAGAAGASRTGGGSRDVPNDLLQGISYGMGGGPGGGPGAAFICRATLMTPGSSSGDGFPIYAPTFTSGIGAAALAAGVQQSDLYDYGERTPVEAYASGDRIPNVDVLDLNADEIEFDLAPAICTSGTVNAAATAPNGTRFDPYIQRLEGGVMQIQLPLEAYFTPGDWTLEANDFSITVEIVAPSRLRTAEMWVSLPTSDVLQVIFGGYMPNEAVVFATNGGISTSVTTNENGYAAAVLNAEYIGSIIAVVPESGQNITVAPIGVPEANYPEFTIPEVYAREIFYNAIYNGARIDLTQWNCPDSPRARILSAYEYARVVTDTVNMRQNPSRNASVVGRLVTNDRVRVTNGIQCADGLTWWEVWYTPPGGSSISGWVAEGDASEPYFRRDGVN